MSYVSLEQFERYTGVHDNPEKLQSFIDAAEGMVENYLGYELGLKKYMTVANGNGREDVQLEARPIREILGVFINGEPMPATQLEAVNEYIYHKKGIFPEGRRNVTVVYNAGFDTDAIIPDNDMFDGGDATNDGDDYIGNADATTPSPILNGGNALLESGANNIPAEIVLTILRIAALLESESNQNIGITGKTFAESGGRTFTNYTNFNKFLFPISRYRLKRV